MHWMVMPLKRYAEFSGRSRRMEYWMWALFQFLIYMTLIIVAMMIAGGAVMSGDVEALRTVGGALIILYGLYMLVALAFFIPSLAVTVRRLHDTDRSGWWILAPLAPYAVALVAALGGAATGTEEGLAAGGIVALVAMLAAVALGIVLLVFMFLDGTPGPNRYGPDPKAAERALPSAAPRA